MTHSNGLLLWISPPTRLFFHFLSHKSWSFEIMAMTWPSKNFYWNCRKAVEVLGFYAIFSRPHLSNPFGMKDVPGQSFILGRWSSSHGLCSGFYLLKNPSKPTQPWFSHIGLNPLPAGKSVCSKGKFFHVPIKSISDPQKSRAKPERQKQDPPMTHKMEFDCDKPTRNIACFSLSPISR